MRCTSRCLRASSLSRSRRSFSATRARSSVSNCSLNANSNCTKTHDTHVNITVAVFLAILDIIRHATIVSYNTYQRDSFQRVEFLFLRLDGLFEVLVFPDELFNLPYRVAQLVFVQNRLPGLYPRFQ